MTSHAAGPDRTRPVPRPGALWAGGAAAGVVAALVSAVAALVCQVLLDADLVPAGDRGFVVGGDPVSYPVLAFLFALAATGLLHLLLVAVPQPLRFFGWIMATVLVAVVVAPFAYDVSTGDQVATAVVGGSAVIATWALLLGTARRATAVQRP
ncbi:MAG: hypothetical protein HOQ22_10320 [Nocardioidaceae bacterium]|nr:hypothetical protein [Nocardioidaceae bacterium]NUS51420.1 hypothetical protein [Nocardioidaceae bacterium]